MIARAEGPRFLGRACRPDFLDECIGQTGAAARLHVETVRLRARRPRVLEWAHDKDKDWRESPKLYR